MTGNYIALGVALLCLGFASGLTVEEAVEAGVKNYYVTKENALGRLDEVFYYKINTRTSIAVATGALGNQVFVGITTLLRPLRVALNVMLDRLQERPNVDRLCRNTLYRTNMDNNSTARLLEVPRAIAVYHTNKFLRCFNSTAQSQYQQLRSITNLESNLRANFLANGTKGIRACADGQTSGESTAECIRNYLSRFEAAVNDIKSQFGDFLMLDNTYLGIPTLYDCADSISYDLDSTVSNVVTSIRSCGRRGNITLQDPRLSSLPKNTYLRFTAEFSVNSGNALNIQTDLTKAKNTLEEYAEEARRRLPVATSPVSDPKIAKALTLFSSDFTLDTCLLEAQTDLKSSTDIPSAGQNGSPCAQNYLNTLFRLQALYNDTDNKLRTTVADESINIAPCISKSIFNDTAVDSCALTLEQKLTALALERDELVKSFARFSINAIFACPRPNNTVTGTTPTNATVLYEKWIRDVYNCIFVN